MRQHTFGWATVLVFVAGQVGQAAIYNFDRGAGNMAWDAGANWNPDATLPFTAADTAVLNINNGTLTASTPGYTAAVGTLQFLGNAWTIGGAGTNLSGLSVNAITGAAGAAQTFPATLTITDLSGTGLTINRTANTDTYNSRLNLTGNLIFNSGGHTAILANTGNVIGGGNVNLQNGTLQARNLGSLGTPAANLNIAGGALQLRSDASTTWGNAVTTTAATTINIDRIATGTGQVHTLGALTINTTGILTLAAQTAANYNSLVFGQVNLSANATISNQITAANTSTTLGPLNGAAFTLTFNNTGEVVFSGTALNQTGDISLSPPAAGGGKLTLTAARVSGGIIKATNGGEISYLADNAGDGAQLQAIGTTNPCQITLGPVTSVGTGTFRVDGRNVIIAGSSWPAAPILNAGAGGNLTIGADAVVAEAAAGQVDTYFTGLAKSTLYYGIASDAFWPVSLGGAGDFKGLSNDRVARMFSGTITANAAAPGTAAFSLQGVGTTGLTLGSGFAPATIGMGPGVTAATANILGTVSLGSDLNNFVGTTFAVPNLATLKLTTPASLGGAGLNIVGGKVSLTNSATTYTLDALTFDARSGGSPTLELTSATSWLNLNADITFLTGPGANNLARITGSGTLNLGVGRTFNIADGAYTPDFSLETKVSGGPLVKEGAGLLSLTKANNDFSGLTINGGTVKLTAIAAAGAGLVTVRSGAALEAAGYYTLGPGSVSVESGGRVTVSNANGLDRQTNPDPTVTFQSGSVLDVAVPGIYGAPLVLNDGAIVRLSDPAGLNGTQVTVAMISPDATHRHTVQLNASGATYASLSSVKAGTVVEVYGGDRTITGSAFSFTNNNVYLTNDDSSRTLLNNATNDLAIGASGLTIAATAGTTFTIAEAIAASGFDLTAGYAGSLNGRDKSTGTVRFNGNVTARNLAHAAGVVSFAGPANSLATVSGAGSINVLTGGVLSFSGNFVADGLVNDGTVNLNSATNTVGTVSGTGTTNIPAGVALSVTGSFAQNALTNAGTVNILAGIADSVNTVSGTGTVSVASGALLSVGNFAQNILTNAGTVTFNGTTSTVGTVSGAGTTGVSAGAALAVTGSFAQNALNNAGTVTFSSATNTIGSGGVGGAGTTIVPAGAAVSVSGNFAQNALANDGVVTINGTTATLGGLSGSASGVTNLNGPTALTVGSGIYAGQLTGAGSSMIKNTTGTLTLTTMPAYTGGTAVNAGTLVLQPAATASMPSGPLSVSAGGTLQFSAPATQTISVPGAGTVPNNGQIYVATGTAAFGNNVITTVVDTSSVVAAAGTTFQAAGLSTATLTLNGTAAGGTATAQLTGANSGTVGTVSLAANNIGTIDQAAANTLTANALSLAAGSALTKTGAGNLTMGTGATVLDAAAIVNVNGGNFLAPTVAGGGSVCGGTINANAGGTISGNGAASALGGAGAITAVNVSSGGFLAGGNTAAPGDTLTITNSNVTFYGFGGVAAKMGTVNTVDKSDLVQFDASSTPTFDSSAAPLLVIVDQGAVLGHSYKFMAWAGADPTNQRPWSVTSGTGQADKQWKVDLDPATNPLWDTGTNWTGPLGVAGKVYYPGQLRSNGLPGPNPLGSKSLLAEVTATGFLAPGPISAVSIAPIAGAQYNVAMAGPADQAAVQSLTIGGANNKTASLTLGAGAISVLNATAVNTGGTLDTGTSGASFSSGSLSVAGNLTVGGLLTTNTLNSSGTTNFLATATAPPTGVNVTTLNVSGGNTTLSGAQTVNSATVTAGTLAVGGGGITTLGISGGANHAISGGSVTTANITGSTGTQINGGTMGTLNVTGAAIGVSGTTTAVTTANVNAGANVTLNNTIAGSPVGLLKLSGGNVTVGALGAATTNVDVAAAGGGVLDATNPLAVGGTVYLPGQYRLAYTPGGGATSFTVAAPNLADANVASAARTLTLSGGTLGLIPSAPSYSNTDIGITPGPTQNGSTSLANGVFTVIGGGADIWGAADGFHFAYIPMTGNFTATARLTSQTQANVWSKAGIMMRETLAAGSSYEYVLATPVGGTNNTCIQWRDGTGIGANWPGTGPALNPPGLPVWLRISRVGNVFTSSRSFDNVTWTQVGQYSATAPFSNNYLVGLAVTSHDANLLSTATFDNVDFMAPPVLFPNTDVKVTATSTLNLANSAYTLGKLTLADGVNLTVTNANSLTVQTLSNGSNDNGTATVTHDNSVQRMPLRVSGSLAPQGVLVLDGPDLILKQGVPASFTLKGNAGGIYEKVSLNGKGMLSLGDTSGNLLAGDLTVLTSGSPAGGWAGTYNLFDNILAGQLKGNFANSTIGSNTLNAPSGYAWHDFDLNTAGIQWINYNSAANAVQVALDSLGPPTCVWTNGAGAGDKKWTTAANWSGGVPGSAGAVAKFDTTAGSPASDTVTLDADTSVGKMYFNATGYSVASASNHILTLDNGSTPAEIQVTAGDHSILAKLMLASNLTISPANGTSLTLADIGESSPGMGITVNDSGKVVLTGIGSVAGDVKVLKGELVLNTVAAWPNGVDVTLGAGGQILMPPDIIFGAARSAVHAAAVSAASVSAVPEPGTLVLLAVGALAALAVGLRRKFGR